MPYLEKKYGLIIGSLILGIVWSVWHYPLSIWPGGNAVSRSIMRIFSNMLGQIGLSFFFSWVITASGNRLLSGVIAHAIGNTFSEFFRTSLILRYDTNQTRLWTYNVFIILIGAIIVVLRTYKSRKTCT